MISHYGAGLPLNRYGSGAYAVNQQFSLYDAASDDQKFKLVTVNNKQRIAMNGNTSLGLNVYRSGDNPCTLYTLLNNDNDSQVSIEACSEGVSDCYYIYLTAHGKSVYTLTAPTNLTSTSARVTWKPYTGSPEQIWKIKTSHTANMYSGHGRYLPSRQDSTVTPFIWPCYKKTGARGYNPSTPHYGIDRDSYYQCSDQRNAPGDPIYPICAETVVKVYEKHADFGNSVWINSSNPNTTAITTGAYIRHLYMHFNSKPLVSVGDPVTTRNVPLLFMTCRNRVYSPELKRQAVEDYLSGKGSQAELSKKYGLRDRRQLRNWLKVYNAHGDFNSRKNSGGGSYMKQGRDTTQEERIQIVKDCLASGKDYGEMALKLQGKLPAGTHMDLSLIHI